MLRMIFSAYFMLSLPAEANQSPSVTVSGLSSGAFMAAQIHVAHSESFQGVAILAGGPFGCSGGNVSSALFSCMQTFLGHPNGERLFRKAQDLATQGEIDSLENLNNDKVVLVTGPKDSTVLSSVVLENKKFYSALPEENFLIIDELPVGHAFPTINKGNPCSTGSLSPWVSACGEDVAGRILQHFLGPLNAAEPARSSSFYRFAQPNGFSLDKTGVAYVPQKCFGSHKCHIHMSLHGCQQGENRGVGDFYFRNVGFNEWAEANNLIVIYPQAISSAGNPNQCWDWWGYIEANYLTKTAPQIESLKSILDSFIDGSIKLNPIE